MNAQTHAWPETSTGSKALIPVRGWLSVAVGLIGLFAPRRAGRLIGLRPKHDPILRLLGVRELALGVGTLTRRRPAAALWSRVAGDVVDLGLLSTALTSPRTNRSRLAVATAGVAGMTALDLSCAIRSRNASIVEPCEGLRLSKSIAVERPAAELYAFWRQLGNLPRFMPFLTSVRVPSEDVDVDLMGMDDGCFEASDGRSCWNVEGPAGTRSEWEAEITEEVPGELIVWRSTDESPVEHSGSVYFEPTPEGRGTIVHVEIAYSPTGGESIGAGVTGLVEQSSEWVLANSLRRFKQLLEVGEIMTTVGQPAGRSHTTSKRYDAATRL